ncbi:MAG: carboxypeptidase regulatory-like domain-containing protein [Candidatus Omnitrophota bacterium]|nr:carboxypeptidase regulatory-like domain-containing protein [Candidatus Omnitrophota bacterium]
MNRRGKVFLIAVLSLFFLSGIVFAEYSNDVPAPTVIIPPKTSTPPPPPPAPEETEQPKIKVTVPQIPDSYETTTPTLTGATVIVRVFESETKKAISGATVKWYGTKYATGGITDSRGEARIVQVMPGDAKITASARGYENNSKTVRAKSSTKVQYFDIYLSKSTKIVPSAEMPGSVVVTPMDTESRASISGIVYDKATKKPMGGVSVKLAGTGPGQNVINETSSDGNGRYTITGCPPGTAVKLIYSKEGYNKEEMTRYIAKTATSYRQDAYLGKGAVEAKKPEKTKEPERKVGTLKSGPGIHGTDLELIRFTLNGQPVPNEGGIIIESPADNNVEFRAHAVNSGPARTTTESVLYFARSSYNGSEINDFPIDLQGEPGRLVEGSQMYIMPPGEYRAGAFVLPGEGNEGGGDVDTDPDLMNNSIVGTVKLIARSGQADAEHPRSTDLAVTTFSINGQPIHDNPIFHLNLDNQDLNLALSIVNNGPDEGTGEASFFVYFEGTNEGPAHVDLTRVGVPISDQMGMPRFPEGTYDIGAELAVPFGDTDPDLSNNTDSGKITVIYDDIPGRGEPEHDEDLRPKGDAELVSFTVEDQPVENNPVIDFPADGRPPRFTISVRNNGPAEADEKTRICMFQGGVFVYATEPIDLAPVGAVLFHTVSIAGIQPGQHVFKATLGVPWGLDDDNLSNNSKSGTVTFGAGGGPGGGRQGAGAETDLEAVSFTIENQPLQNNPRIELPADGNINLGVQARNNGRDETTAPAEFHLGRIDGGVVIEGEPIPLDLGGQPGIIGARAWREPAVPGVYNIIGTVRPGAGSQDIDPNLANNDIVGMVTIVGRGQDAGAGPAGNPPGGGQGPGGVGNPPGGGQGPGAGWQPPAGPGGAAPGGAGPGAEPAAGLLGGAAPNIVIPQEVSPEVAAAKGINIEPLSSPVVHPRMGSGPEFVKEFFGQVPVKKAPELVDEKKETEEPAVGKEKNKILWLITILSGIGLFIILAVIAKKKKKKNGA